MDPFTTDPSFTAVALGIIANFGYNLIRGHRMAERAFDGLKRILFGDAETESDLEARHWARLYNFHSIRYPFHIWDTLWY